METLEDYLNGNVGIGVFPKREEILICIFRFDGVAL